MFSYREQLAIGAVIFAISLAGLSWRLYRLFFRSVTRPMIQVYIILFAFFVLGLFGLYMLATAHRITNRNAPHLRDVVPAPMLLAQATPLCCLAPYALSR